MSSITTLKNVEYKLLKMRRIDPETGCWLFTGGLTNGYGRMQLNHKQTRVHRIAAMLYLGYDLESPFIICHKIICSNKHCFNPKHLYIGDTESNSADAIFTGTHASLIGKAKTHCPSGHEYSEENTGVDKNGSRFCKTCRKEWQQNHK